MGVQAHVGIEAQVVEIGRQPGLLHIGIDVQVERKVEGIGDGTYGARQFGERSFGIGELDGLDGGIQGGVVVGDFAHGLDALSEGEDLGALAGAQAADGRAGLALGALEAVAGAHAEGIVDGQHGDFAGAAGGQDVLPDVGVGESQNKEQDEGRAEGEEQEITQAAVLDGTLNMLLEEHERAEGQRVGAVLAQQVQPDGQPDGDRSGEEPGG